MFLWVYGQKKPEDNNGIRSDETDEAGVRGAPRADSQDTYHSLFEEREESGERSAVLILHVFGPFCLFSFLSECFVSMVFACSN